MVKYEQAKENALAKESKEMTLDQLLAIAYSQKEKFTDDDKHIDVPKMKIVLREQGIKIGHSKSYDLKTLMEYRFPNDFSEE